MEAPVVLEKWVRAGGTQKGGKAFCESQATPSPLSLLFTVSRTLPHGQKYRCHPGGGTSSLVCPTTGPPTRSFACWISRCGRLPPPRSCWFDIASDGFVISLGRGTIAMFARR